MVAISVHSLLLRGVGRIGIIGSQAMNGDQFAAVFLVFEDLPAIGSQGDILNYTIR